MCRFICSVRRVNSYRSCICPPHDSASLAWSVTRAESRLTTSATSTKTSSVMELTGSSAGFDLRLPRGEVAVHQNRGERHHDRLPESAQQGGGNHNQQIKQDSHGQQPLRPMCKGRDQNDGHNAQRALQGKQQHVLT